MKSLNETIREGETKKRQLEESLDALQEEVSWIENYIGIVSRSGSRFSIKDNSGSRFFSIDTTKHTVNVNPDLHERQQCYESRMIYSEYHGISCYFKEFHNSDRFRFKHYKNDESL